MRKLLIAIAVVFIATFTSNAQYIVSAGYTHNNYVTTYLSSGIKVPLKGNGFFLMGRYQHSLNEKTNVSAGLRLDYIGLTEQLTYTTAKNSQIHVGIPVMISTYKDFGNEIGVGIEAGPTFSLGLLNHELIYVDGVRKGDPINVYEDGLTNRFNVLLGANVFADIFHQFRASVGFDYGILDLNKNDYEQKKHSRINIGLSMLL